MALNPTNVKRPLDRRFPIYKADLIPYQDSPEGQDHTSASSGAPNPPKARTYAETVNHHYLLFQDTDLRSFHGLPHREPMLRMQEGEGQTRLCLTGCSWKLFIRYVSVQTWTLTDGWSLEGSRGWFGSILSVDSPVHWATVCSLKAEPISVLCSSWPPPLQGLAFLQPAIAFCPVPSHGPHRTLGMKSAENNWLRAHSHRNWGLPGQ